MTQYSQRYSRNQSKIGKRRHDRRVVNLPTQPPQPTPKSNLSTSIVLGVVGALAIGAVFVAPYIVHNQTPKVNSVLFTDVSQSNQRFKAEMQELCRARLELLKEGDLRIDGKFADRPYITSNRSYEERDRLSLQQDCQTIVDAPKDVGDRQGTNLLLAVESLEREVKHQRTLGNTQPVVAIIAIQAAEPGDNARQDLNGLSAKVKNITNSNGVVLFVGAELDLQEQLKQLLVGINNTDVCTYAEGKRCLERAFEIARK